MDLIAAGRKVADIARDLGVSGRTIYNWRKQDRIDRGLEPGVSTTELTKARRRISELETELAAVKRSQQLLKEMVPPTGRFDIIRQMAESVTQSKSLAVRVSTPGGKRAPSARSIRHAWLIDLITQIRHSDGGFRIQGL